MGEPTLAEALNAAEVPRSQHGDSGSLDEPAQPLPGRADRPPVFPASMESMLAVGTRLLTHLPSTSQRPLHSVDMNSPCRFEIWQVSSMA